MEVGAASIHGYNIAMIRVSAGLLLLLWAQASHAAMRAVRVPVSVPGVSLGAAGLSAAGQLTPVTGGLLAPVGVSWSPGLPSPALRTAPLAAPAAAPASPITAPLSVPVAAPLSPALAPFTGKAGNPIASPAAPSGESLRAVLGNRVRDIRRANARDSSGRRSRNVLDSMFTGAGAPAVSAGGVLADSLVNNEGVRIFGRARWYYEEVERIVDKYKGVLDLSESLDVMGDAYADVWSKLTAIEALAESRKVSGHNTHLDHTLTWVDGVISEKGRRTAVQTHRVYFHPAENPRSEIEEGIRRVDRYLLETTRLFLRRGEAEDELGRFDEVAFVFDTRGYDEIKAHIRSRERAFRKAFGGRFKFMYLDEMTRMPRTDAEMRSRLNGLIDKYSEDRGLSKIVEGVIYSRYVGLLLELKTVEHFVDKAHELLQSGHELFDENGKYVTELDLIVRSPEGKVSLVEAKSARVPLPFRQVLKEKVVSKLKTYRRHWKALEESAGHPIDEVVFSFDVGSNRALAAFLKRQEGRLSREFGVPVRFLFIESSPEAAPRIAEASGRAPSGKTQVRTAEKVLVKTRGKGPLLARLDAALDLPKGELAFVEARAPVAGGTIRENLLAGNRRMMNASELRHMIRKSGSLFLLDGKRFPKGLDTKLTRRSLKAEERQRLALTRAYLRAPDVMILDGFGKGLDKTARKRLAGYMETVGRGRTVIYTNMSPDSAYRVDRTVDLDR